MIPKFDKKTIEIYLYHDVGITSINKNFDY